MQVSEQQRTAAQALEARFTTFKASVAANVADSARTMQLLDEKVDALARKISQILKTVVIM